ncbi:DUF4430 domain-containing protein [Candidatus Parcubacteria bacterium]|nr:DUF4430 domain-containing protein [Candidatus Parcubacteria bacterium]
MKNLKIFIGIGVAVIVIIGSWIISIDKSENFQENVSQENVSKEVVLIIDDGEQSPKIFKTDFKKEMYVFDLLEQGSAELDLTLKTKTYDIGVMIEAIGNTENGKDGKYWMYYVNKEMPMVSADKKLINKGDRVEFKFEKSSF